MLDNAAICAKLHMMLGYYNELRQVASGLSIDTYKENLLIKRTIEREIQLIVESATDINNMVLKKINKGPANFPLAVLDACSTSSDCVYRRFICTTT